MNLLHAFWPTLWQLPCYDRDGNKKKKSYKKGDANKLERNKVTHKSIKWKKEEEKIPMMQGEEQKLIQI